MCMYIYIYIYIECQARRGSIPDNQPLLPINNHEESKFPHPSVQDTDSCNRKLRELLDVAG